MTLSKYFYGFLDGNTIENLLIVFVVLVIVVVVGSFISFFDGIVVAVNIAVVENKGWLASLGWYRGRDVCCDGAHACIHLPLMLMLLCLREREVVPSSMVQDFIHLSHERDEGIVNGAHR